MKIDNAPRLKIKLKDEDSKNFKSALQKITDEIGKIGFTNKMGLTQEEQKVITELNQKIK